MDILVQYLLEGGAARAMVLETTALVQEAREVHDLSNTATAALGRTLTGTLMLSAMQKGEDDRLTVTLRGEGPYSPVVAVSNERGGVKGYLEAPELELPPRDDGKLDVGAGIGHEGRMVVVRDVGYGEPYVGQTRLVSGEVAQDFALYLTVSEQTPSVVALGVRVRNDRVAASAGILIQPLPDCPEETLTKLEALAPRLDGLSTQLEEAGDARSLAARVFEGLEIRELESRPLRWHCDCSQARIERALISMGKAELNDMIEQQGGAELTCHFCRKQYRLSADELRCLVALAEKP